MVLGNKCKKTIKILWNINHSYFFIEFGYSNGTEYDKNKHNFEKRKIRLSLTEDLVCVIIWLNKGVNDGNYKINLARVRDTMSLPE